MGRGTATQAEIERAHKPSKGKGSGANKSLRIIKIIYNQRNLLTSSKTGKERTKREEELPANG